MTQAYEYGVRELWIVNVGDVKGAEYPLCYFMDLAYDYETYSQPNQTEAYAKTWIEQQFGSRLNPEDKEALFVLLDGFTKCLLSISNLQVVTNKQQNKIMIGA